jgi:hypothetical protein
LERIWKETVIVIIEALFWNLLKGPREGNTHFIIIARFPAEV